MGTTGSKKSDNKKHGVDQGKLELVMYGKKLRGEWHLVRTKSEKNEWLIFKARDRYVRKGDEPPPFFDLTAAVESPPLEPPLEKVELMGIGGTTTPFSDPGWVFEMKFVGQRATILKRGDDVKLLEVSGEPLDGKAFRSSRGSRRAPGGERSPRRGPGGARRGAPPFGRCAREAPKGDTW